MVLFPYTQAPRRSKGNSPQGRSTTLSSGCTSGSVLTRRLIAWWGGVQRPWSVAIRSRGLIMTRKSGSCSHIQSSRASSGDKSGPRLLFLEEVL